MSIPAGHSRYVFFGHLEGGEIFETGFWAAGAFETQELTQDAADTAAGQFIISPALDYTQGLITPSSGYDGIRVYTYPDGGPAAAFVAEADMVFAGDGTGHLPDQAALVLTLLTGAAGRRNRGRMYLPANGIPLTSLNVDSTVVTGLANGWADYFENYASADPAVEVLSQVGAGSARPVTQVRVDSKVDIQRRRANKQVAGNTHTSDVG